MLKHHMSETRTGSKSLYLGLGLRFTSEQCFVFLLCYLLCQGTLLVSILQAVATDVFHQHINVFSK